MYILRYNFYHTGVKQYMLATLTFLGAAQNVTGSCYLLESYGTTHTDRLRDVPGAEIPGTKLAAVPF